MNVPAAIAALAAAGVTRPVLAAELGVHRTTVARWEAGRQCPDARNLAALKDLVDDLHRGVLAGDTIASGRQDSALTAARDALLPDAERADVEAFAARLIADLEAYLSRPDWVTGSTGMSAPFAHCLEDAA